MTSCQFNATLNGIGDFVVASATAGHAAPEKSSVIDGKIYTYYAQSFDNAVPPNITGWEAGSGTYVILTHTLHRTTIIANSNGDLNPVNFPLPPIVDVYASPSGSLETVLRSYLAGLTLSTAGSSSTFAVAAGQAADSTNASLMPLAGAISKTTAAWAVGTGNGSFDGTGAAPSATAAWYHVYLIKRPDTDAVDVLTSISATAPTLPANYTLFRRVGSMKTNGSFQWVAFIQDGDTFQWLANSPDVQAVNSGLAAITRTMNTPLGVRVEGIFTVGCSSTTTAPAYYLSDLSVNDEAPTISVPIYSGVAVAGSSVTQSAVGNQRVFTNTSSQIRSRLASSAADLIFSISTRGWVDRRGRDS